MWFCSGEKCQLQLVSVSGEPCVLRECESVCTWAEGGNIECAASASEGSAVLFLENSCAK